MIESSREVTVKGYANKKHKFSIERTKVGGHESVHVKKNGNIVVTCTPKEFIKLKILFCED